MTAISAAEPSRRDFLYIVTAAVGAIGGWFCPCHGSQYDAAGCIRQGLAPLNLALPPYHFVSDIAIRIGETAPGKA